MTYPRGLAAWFLAAMLVLSGCTRDGSRPPAPPGPQPPMPQPPAATPGGSQQPPGPVAPAPPPRTTEPPAPAPAPGNGNGRPADPGAAPRPAPPPSTVAGVAGKPLPEGCGGGLEDRQNLEAPYITVAPGWGRPGNMPFPMRTARRSDCTFAVGGSSIAVEIRLPAGATEELARKAFRLAGPAPTYLNFYPDGPRLSLGYGPGPATETWELALEGPVAPDGGPLDFRITLVRDFPVLAVDARQGEGPWRPLRQEETWPPGPITLRFRWDRPVDKAEAEMRVRRARGIDRLNPQPLLLWPDDQTLEVRMTAAPALALVDMGGVPGPGSIGTYTAPAVLRTGTAPAVVAVDPATGKADELSPAPPEVFRALADPGGRWLAVSAHAPQPEGNWWTPTAWALDLGGRRSAQAPFGLWYGWAAGGLLVGGPAEGQVQAWNPGTNEVRRYTTTAGAVYHSLSPDGRLLAGFRIHYDKEDRDTFVAPADLYILDLQSGQERPYPDWAGYYVSHSEVGAPFPILWVDGGRVIAGRDYRSRQLYNWVALDLATGARRPLTAEEVARLPAEPSLLQGPSGWWLEQARPWDPVTLHGPDGSTLDLGAGFLAGWLPNGRPLVVRWEAAPLRYRPPEGP